MNPQFILYIITVLLIALTITLNWKYSLLKDSSIAVKRPYSYARVQMAWWTIIILSSLVAIIFSHRGIPNLDRSTLILYSLGTATALAAGMVDIKHDADPDITNASISRNQPSQGFWVDIASDNSGMSWPRIQAIACNVIFGVYFWYMVWFNLPLPISTTFTIDSIMPVINDTTLVMMGISATAYVGFKMSENKPEAK